MGHQSQADFNYDAFVAELPNLLRDHEGSYALLHNGKVIDFFSTSLEATLEGSRRFGSDDFSVQEVTAEPEHLGFYSYVGGSGPY